MSSISKNVVKQIELESLGKDPVNKQPSMLPDEDVWLWDLSEDSWLRVDLD